jgi:beta-glucosidase
MGFEGLITTDALMMAGVANLGNAGEIAIRAVLAGADILLMPTDAIATIEALVAAVESGQISRDRIRESVQRIWRAKQKVFGSVTDLLPDLQKLGNPENLQIAKEIASRAITVHSQISNNAKNTDLTRLNLLIVDDPLTCGEFLTARSPAVVLPKAQGYSRMVSDGLTLANLDCWHSDRFSQVLIQIFSRGNPFRGNTNLLDQLAQIVEQAIALQKLEALVVYGSPYCLDRFLAILPSDIPWGFAYSQQPEAQAAVLQKMGLQN